MTDANETTRIQTARRRMSSRAIARSALCCALLACSAWVTIPIGLVPFTLQTLVLAIIAQVMPAKQALFTVIAYVAIGACGIPVFSGFQTGLGVLAGPTGGYIWGFIVAMIPAGAIAHIERVPAPVRGVAAGAALLAVSYTLGTLQLMALYSLSAPAALASAVLPFIIPDAIKIVIGTSIASAVRRALG